MVADNRCGKFRKVCRKRFRIVGEVPVRSAVQLYALNTESLQQSRHDDSPDRVNRVKDHLETGLPDSFCIDCLECEHRIYMPVSKISLLHCTEVFDTGEIKLPAVSALKYGGPCIGIEELALPVKELQGVPLHRVMRRSQDDPAVGMLENDSHLSCRGRGEPGLDHIHSAGHKSAADNILHHPARDTGVLPDHYLIALAFLFRHALPELCTIGIREFNNIHRGEGIPRNAAYSPPYSRNRFNQSHNK